MTAYKSVEIICDAECDNSTDGAGSSVAEARRFAKEWGWVYRAGKDYCPAHADRIGGEHGGADG